MTGQLVPRNAQEEVRQTAARFLVESLGYPRADLIADVPLTHDHREPFVAALMVTKGESSPFIVVEVAPPGATPPQSVPSAVAESGAQFYFWFDGFWDDRRGPISRGAYYFERRGGDFAQVPSLPHHHRPAKQRHRRRPTNHRCPRCGRRLELFCAIPCTDRCRRWGCYWYSLIHCPSCQQRWTRPRPAKQRD